MKKKLISILIFSLILLTSCVNNDSFEVDCNKINDYFIDNIEKSNIETFYIDNDNKTIIVSLIDNTKESQKEFEKQIKVDSNHIKYIEGISYKYNSSKLNYFITKKKNYELEQYVDMYKEYYKDEQRKIYLLAYLDEFYILMSDNDVKTLKNYIIGVNQTPTRTIEIITDELDKKGTLLDGGTTIYNSKEKDIAVIVCNTVDGNKDVYIGDYSMQYESSMCK